MPSDRDLRPLLVTAAVAVVSVGVLALGVRSGWLGPDVGRGDNFCEAAGPGPVVQPANTWSNGGFVVAGLLIAWRATRRDRLGDVLQPALATAYACVVVLLGPASAAMHATQSALGGHLDLLSMHLIAAFAAAYAWVRWARRGPAAFGVAYVAALAGSELVGLWPRPVPVVQYAGNVAFALLLLVAVALEVALWRRGETSRDVRPGLAALGAMLTAFAIWLLSTHGWCDPESLLQGHAAWHLLGAVAAYFLFRFYASERRNEPGSAPDTAPDTGAGRGADRGAERRAHGGAGH